MRKIDVLGEDGVRDAVELSRRGEVAAEGLFDDDARVLGQARGAQALDHGLEQRGRDGEVVRRPLGRAERRLERREGRRVLVVAADVAAAATAACRTPLVVDAARLLDAVAHALLQSARCSRLEDATPMTGTFSSPVFTIA